MNMAKNKNISLYETMVITKWVLEYKGKIHKNEAFEICLNLYFKKNHEKIFDVIEKNNINIDEQIKNKLIEEDKFLFYEEIIYYYKLFLNENKKEQKHNKISNFSHLNILKKYGRKDPKKDDVWIYDPENSVKNDSKHLINFLRKRYFAIIDKTFETFNNLIFINKKNNNYTQNKWNLIHKKNNEHENTCQLNIDFLIVDEKNTIGIPFSFIMINEKQIKMIYNANEEESEILFKFDNNHCFFEDDYFLKNRLYKLVNKFDVRL